MFWVGINNMGSNSSREVEREFLEKLDTPDISLEAIISDPYCLQEVQNGGPKILEYLKQEEVLRELLNGVIKPLPCDFHRDKYKFAHHCTDVIVKASNDVCGEVMIYEGLVDELIKFPSNHPEAEPPIVGYWTKIIIAFINAEPEQFLAKLTRANFIRQCVSAVDFCTIVELLCTLTSCSPDVLYRDRVKAIYLHADFASSLLETIVRGENLMLVSNAAMVWSELIKSMRGDQQNVEMRPDPLLDSLQSLEIVRSLLAKIFASADVSPLTQEYGLEVLNTLLETNATTNTEPSYASSQDASFVGDLSGYSNITYIADPDRKVEAECAHYAVSVIKLALRAIEQKTNGGLMAGCMRMLLYLSTSTQAAALRKALDTEGTTLAEMKKHAVRGTIYNAMLVTIEKNMMAVSSAEEPDKPPEPMMTGDKEPAEQADQQHLEAKEFDESVQQCGEGFIVGE